MPIRELTRFFLLQTILFIKCTGCVWLQRFLYGCWMQVARSVHDAQVFASSSIHTKLTSSKLPSTFQTPVKGGVKKQIISLVIQHIHCFLSAWKSMMLAPATNKSFLTTCCVLPETISNVLFGDSRQDGPFSLQKWTSSLSSPNNYICMFCIAQLLWAT